MHRKINEAETRAKAIFSAASSALMAHSVRGVETYLKNHLVRTHITIRVVPNLYKETGRNSFLVDTGGGKVEISLELELTDDYKRICIAHELYHVLIWRDPTMKEQPTKAETEEFCDVFANRLCVACNHFYMSGKAVEAGQFKVQFPVRATPKKTSFLKIDECGNATVITPP